jgi:heat shock protein HslJ
MVRISWRSNDMRHNRWPIRWPIAGILLALVLAFALAACGSLGVTVEPTAGVIDPAGGPEALDLTAEVVDLDGTEWILTLLQGAELLAGTNITLEFTEGRVSGFAGCNAYGGPYVVDGPGLAIQELETTAQGCIEPEGVMDQESAYTQALLDGTAYPQADGRLEIQDDAGETLLVFERKEEVVMDPGDLPGTVWQLVSTNGTPPIEDSTITLGFQDGGHASGQAGCRYFTATYEASGDDIHFPFMSMTGDDACLAREELYRQEGDYTDALTWATNYRLSEGRFELLTARGKVLVFEPLTGEPEPGLEGAGPDFPPTDYGCEQSFYMAWNSHRLEELSEQVQSALDKAGLVGAEGYAEAYGEDWYEQAEDAGDSPTVCNFSIMETDFYVTLPAENLADYASLGMQVSEVLSVVDGFSVEETPGSQPGYVDIRFVSDGEEARLRVTVTEAAQAGSDGLAGAQLLEALGYSGFPCHGYLDLLVYADDAREQAVVTSYSCQGAHIDSTGQSPGDSPSFSTPAGEPLHLHLAAPQPPQFVEARLYPGAGVSASFFRWPEDLPPGIAPLEQYQPGPTSDFQIVPQSPPGAYSLVVRATWGEGVEVFYALSLGLE